MYFIICIAEFYLYLCICIVSCTLLLIVNKSHLLIIPLWYIYTCHCSHSYPTPFGAIVSAITTCISNHEGAYGMAYLLQMFVKYMHVWCYLGHWKSVICLPLHVAPSCKGYEYTFGCEELVTAVCSKAIGASPCKSMWIFGQIPQHMELSYLCVCRLMFGSKDMWCYLCVCNRKHVCVKVYQFVSPK